MSVLTEALKRELQKDWERFGRVTGIEVVSLKDIGRFPRYSFSKGQIYNALDYGILEGRMMLCDNDGNRVWYG